MDVQEIYFTLAADAESATFEATVKLLDDYFVPKVNVPFEETFVSTNCAGKGRNR